MDDVYKEDPVLREIKELREIVETQQAPPVVNIHGLARMLDVSRRTADRIVSSNKSFPRPVRFATGPDTSTNRMWATDEVLRWIKQQRD